MAVTACMMMSMLKARRCGTTNNRRARAYQLWRCFIEGTLRPGTQQVRFRVRVTERTYNLSLPPYKFPKAKFFPQQEIDDDGPPPRQVCTPKEPCQRHERGVAREKRTLALTNARTLQFAHTVGWNVSSKLEILETSEGRGALIRTKEHFSKKFNEILKYRQARALQLETDSPPRIAC